MIRFSTCLIFAFLTVSCSSNRSSDETKDTSIEGQFELISRRCSSIHEVRDGLDSQRGDSVFFRFHHGRYTVDTLVRGQNITERGSYRSYGKTLLMSENHRSSERSVEIERTNVGNYLTMISRDDDRGYCPEGDRVISILQRIE